MYAKDVPVGVMFHYQGGLFLRIKGGGVTALVITPITPKEYDVEPVEALDTTPFNANTEVEVYEGS